MKKQTSIALAAAVLLSGVTAASAATMSNSAKAGDTQLKQHTAKDRLARPLHAIVEPDRAFGI